jgi:hypothetical protein
MSTTVREKESHDAAPVLRALPTDHVREWRPSLAALMPRDAHRLALSVLPLVTLLLRLWGTKQGLPYSYNIDEAAHFVPRAIAFFSHDLKPQYFLNPPAYSYVLHGVF